MDVKNLVMAVVGMVLAVVMIGGALLPSVAGALVISGEPITIEQTGNGVNTWVELGEITTETVVIDVLDGGFTVNGVEYPSYTGVSLWTNIVFSDVGMLNVRKSDQLIQWYDFENLDGSYKTLSVGDSVTLTNDSIFINSTTDKSYTPTLVYSVGSSNSVKYVAPDVGTYDSVLVSSYKDIVALGAYTSGDNDTIYRLVNGVLTIGGAFDHSFNVETSLYEGTTDIYIIDNLTITIGGESFTPYYVLVPVEVSGHTTSGAIYTMLSVVPIVVVAGLIMAGIYVFISRK